MFLYQLRRFRNMSFWYFFQTFFSRKQSFAHRYFSYKNESLLHCYSYDMRQMATFSFLEVQFFQRVCFSGGMFFFQVQVPVQVQLLDNVLLLLVIPPSNNFTRALLQKTDTKFYVLLLLVFMQRKSRSKEIIFTFF